MAWHFIIILHSQSPYSRTLKLVKSFHNFEHFGFLTPGLVISNSACNFPDWKNSTSFPGKFATNSRTDLFNLATSITTGHHLNVYYVYHLASITKMLWYKPITHSQLNRSGFLFLLRYGISNQVFPDHWNSQTFPILFTEYCSFVTILEFLTFP